MKHIGTVILMILAASTSAWGQEAENDLKQLEDKIAAAIVSRDTTFVERVFASEFVYTGVRGEVKARADIVAELKAGDLQFDLLKFDDVKVRIYGDAAVVTGRATTKGRSKQGEISGEFRYTRVYVKRSGAWQLVAFQGTPLAAAK